MASTMTWDDDERSVYVQLPLPLKQNESDDVEEIVYLGDILTSIAKPDIYDEYDYDYDEYDYDVNSDEDDNMFRWGDFDKPYYCTSVPPPSPSASSSDLSNLEFDGSDTEPEAMDATDDQKHLRTPMKFIYT